MVQDTWELWFEEKRHLFLRTIAKIILKMWVGQGCVFFLHHWQVKAWRWHSWYRNTGEISAKTWSEAESGMNRLRGQVKLWRDVNQKAGAPEDRYQSWPPLPTSFTSCFFILLPITSFIHTSTPISPYFNLTFPTLFPSINDQSLLSAFITMKVWMADGPFLRSTVLEKQRIGRESRIRISWNGGSDSNFWWWTYGWPMVPSCVPLYLKSELSAWNSDQDIMERRLWIPTVWCSRYLLGRTCRVIWIEGIESYISNRICWESSWRSLSARNKTLVSEPKSKKRHSGICRRYDSWTQLCQDHNQAVSSPVIRHSVYHSVYWILSLAISSMVWLLRTSKWHEWWCKESHEPMLC